MHLPWSLCGDGINDQVAVEQADDMISRNVRRCPMMLKVAVQLVQEMSGPFPSPASFWSKDKSGAVLIKWNGLVRQVYCRFLIIGQYDNVAIGSIWRRHEKSPRADACLEVPVFERLWVVGESWCHVASLVDVRNNSRQRASL